jgi:Family of unknown function (DUF6356)
MFAHLRDVRLGYFRHLARAWSISLKMLVGAVAVFVHGLLPCVFVTTASNTIRRLARLFE